jgi:hypothetical protein
MVEVLGFGRIAALTCSALAGALTACLIWAPPALAQAGKTAQAPTDLSGVVVAAPKPSTAPRSPMPTPAIRKFVQSRGVTTRIGQLARWGLPVCPFTEGLSPGFNAFVIQRIKDVAAQVGAPVDTHAKCGTNILVIFTPQPQALLDNIRKKNPALLGFHYVAQLKDITAFTHPIQAWHVTGTRGVNGFVAQDDACCPEPGGAPGSRLTAGLSSEIIGGIVVADSRLVADHTVGAISDYVALLALSQTTPADGCDSLPSVLDVLAPACPDDQRPDGLTDGDIAYLKALYAIDTTALLPLEQAEIADRMQKTMHDPGVGRPASP